MPKKAKMPDLEKSFAELETIMDKMDQEELSLDKSLQQFERGVALIKHARGLLDHAEQKITHLTDKK